MVFVTVTLSAAHVFLSVLPSLLLPWGHSHYWKRRKGAVVLALILFLCAISGPRDSDATNSFHLGAPLLPRSPFSLRFFRSNLTTVCLSFCFPVAHLFIFCRFTSTEYLVRLSRTCLHKPNSATRTLVPLRFLKFPFSISRPPFPFSQTCGTQSLFKDSAGTGRGKGFAE